MALLAADRPADAADAVLESIAFWRAAVVRAPQYRAALHSALHLGSRPLWGTDRYIEAYAAEANLASSKRAAERILHIDLRA